ncbi:uncharacterized protein LOC120161901 [Hibiscus syriacus]|uniref:uncharacterized protein LOC120161901 n=1 Tax=Hibiscus syriacus TaxID=106335 RepID=UPI001924DF03|nr:uncharacterized protein LOC120161901 [Hibiscus syriacus]
MDLQDIIIAMSALGRKRKEKTRMKKFLRDRQAALRNKAMECEMLKRKKQSMLAKQAANQKLVDDFMLFIDTNGDVKDAHNFDEKAMMSTILTRMNGGGGNIGNNGGFATDDGKKEA